MKKIFSIIIIGLSLYSCTNETQDILKPEENTKKIASFEDYYKFINSDTKNKIIIQNIGSPMTKDRIQSISSVSIGETTPLQLIMNGENLTSNKIYKSANAVSWYNNKNVNSIFGKTITFKMLNGQISAKTALNKTTSKTIGEGEVSMYIPELINADITGLVNGNIVPGTKISWNADILNENGIVLGVEYNPLTQIDPNIAQQYTERIVRGSTLTDDGSYTITLDDLNNFPDGAALSFYIGRAGYVISNDGSTQNDVSVGAYTALRSDFDIQY